MAVRKPLVYVNGVRSELPVGDSVSIDFGWLTGKPTTLAGYGITDAVNLNGVQTVVGVKTFTDDIFITTTGASGGLVIDSPAGSLSEIWLRSGTSLRWSIRKSNEAESGSDAGSNLDFNSYTDAGTIKSRVARWNRNTGILDFTNMPTVGGAALYSLATAPTYYSNTSGYNVNNLTPGQRVTVGASVTNAPVSAGITYWYIACESTYLADGASRLQRAVSWDGAVSAMRTLHSGTWTAWAYTWHSGNFDPATKANTSGATFTGLTRIAGQDLFKIRGGTDSRITFEDSSGIRRALLTMNPTTGVAAFVAYASDGGTSIGQFEFGTGGIKYDGGSMWHSGNFDPATKLDKDALVYPYTDVNSFTQVGGALFTSTALNTPTGDWATVMSSGGGDRGFQIAEAWNTTAERSLFWRRNNVGWSPWYEMWHSGNVTFSSVASNGTAVLRSASGYIYAGYINTTGGAQIATTAGSLWVETGNDGFHRRQTPAQFIANHSIATTSGGVDFAGEVISRGANTYRAIAGNYGAFWRNDGVDFHLLFTASGDQYGSWNTLRPFSVNLSSGAVTMQQGLNVYAGLTVSTGALQVNSGAINVTPGSGNGINLWNSPNYAIYMSSSADATYGGRAAGDPNSDYNMYFKMTSGTNRGFTFKNGSTVVGGISGSGVVSDIKGDVRRTPAATSNATTQIVAAHVNTIVEKSNTTAYNYAINANIGQQGDAITFVNSGTAGNLGILQGTGVTIVRNGTAGTVTVPPGSMVTCVLSATANKWVCG